MTEDKKNELLSTDKGAPAELQSLLNEQGELDPTAKKTKKPSTDLKEQGGKPKSVKPFGSDRIVPQ